MTTFGWLALVSVSVVADVGTLVVIGAVVGLGRVLETIVVGGAVVTGAEVDSSLGSDCVPAVICARPTPAEAANANPTNASAIVLREKRLRPGTGLPSLEDWVYESSRRCRAKLAPCITQQAKCRISA
jgi:hypothetical protein